MTQPKKGIIEDNISVNYVQWSIFLYDPFLWLRHRAYSGWRAAHRRWSESYERRRHNEPGFPGAFHSKGRRQDRLDQSATLLASGRNHLELGVLGPSAPRTRSGHGQAMGH